MRLVATNGYFVDNDPSGPSGGDLFGSAGDLRRHGHKIGRASSACTLVPPVGAQCQVTLIRRRGGRIQLAGDVRFPATTRNRLAIVGGTGKFRRVRGDAIFQSLNDQGSVQRLHLTILR
jgi:dirigent-like protein